MWAGMSAYGVCHRQSPLGAGVQCLSAISEIQVEIARARVKARSMSGSSHSWHLTRDDRRLLTKVAREAVKVQHCVIATTSPEAS